MADIHAESWNGDSRTLCGLVLEGFDGDGKDVVLLAAPRSVVTCADCKRAIAHCQDSYTGSYRRRVTGAPTWFDGGYLGNGYCSFMWARNGTSKNCQLPHNHSGPHTDSQSSGGAEHG